jgi:hypothetical protein
MYVHIQAVASFCRHGRSVPLGRRMKLATLGEVDPKGDLFDPSFFYIVECDEEHIRV